MMNKFTNYLSIAFFLVFSTKLLAQCPTVNPPNAGPDLTSSACGAQVTLTAPAVYNVSFTVATTACLTYPTGGTNAFPTTCDDCVTGQVPIGFPFSFFGNTYTTAVISSNGIVGFGNFTFTGYSPFTIPAGGNPNNYIAGLLADIDIRFGGTINYQTVGTSPNRQFVVSYNNVVPYSSGGAPPAGMTASFQIILNENGTFNTRISQFSATWNSSTSGTLATQGAENSDGTVAIPSPGRNAQDFRGITTPSCNTFSPINCTFLRWQQGATTLTTSPTTTVTPSANTTYTSYWTCSTGTCTDDLVVNVPGPTVTIANPNTVICGSQPVTLTASGATNYVWSTGATTSSINVTPTSTTVYRVTGTTGACSANASSTVTVNVQTISCPTNINLTECNPIATFTTPTATDVCGASSAPLSTILANFNTNASTIASSVVNPFNFTLDGTGGATGTDISDGGSDMYDGGNSLNTNLGISIPYTGGATATNANFGTGGSYFTQKFNNFFVMAANINNITSFSISGNNGADGSGTAAGFTYSANIGGINYNVFVKTVCGAGDPSVNQVIIVPAGGSPSQTFSTNTDDAAQSVTGLNSATRLYYLLFAGSSGYCYSNTEVQNAVQSFLTQVSAAGTGGNATVTQTAGLPSGSSFPVGTNTVTFRATGSTGATATCSFSVVVTPRPSGAITGTTTICAGNTTTLTASGTGTYAWSTGATTQSINTSTAGVYTVTVTGTSGCTNTGSVTVTVNPLPTPSVTGTNVICAGESTTLTASGGNSYLWSTGASTAAITASPGTNTTYSVTATSAAGCTAVASRAVTVNVTPTPSVVGTNTICIGQSTTLTASGGSSYIWNTGATTAAITVAPAATINYIVTVTNVSGCTATGTRTVTVNALPTPSISGTNIICEGQSTTLNATGGNSYLWNTGAVTSGITVSPISTTTYTVTATSPTGCTAVASRTVTVNPLPTPSIGGTNVICNSQSTTLTASGGNTYTWSTGATTAAVTVSPVANTTYTVTATSAAGCTAVASRTVTVNALPTPSIGGTNVICNGQSTTLTATGGASYVWSSGQNTAAITISPATSTSYTATATDANGCSATATRTVTVNALPTPSIGGTNVICNGQSTTLTATGGVSYVWSSGQNTAAITVAPTTTTSYTATATDANGCSATAARTVTVNPLPTPSIGGTNVICNGQSTTLTASGGASYVWSSGQNTAAITVAPSANITYTVTATSVAGCTAVASRTVTVNALPTPSIGGTNVICNGQSTTLTASGGVSYVWSSGQNTAAITVAPVATTSYTATVTDANGCSATANRTVTVNALPTPSIGGTNVICVGQSTTLTASGGTSYVWSSGQNTAAITVAPASTTTYTVTATNASGCTAVASRTVTANALPTPSIAGTNVICNGQSTTLTASGGVSYVWSSGQNTAAITISPATSTSYTATATDANGCSATATRTVTVNALPTPSISGTNVICAGQSTTLTASGGTSYVWSSGQNTAAITISPASTTSYIVTASNASGCTATANRTVTVNPLPIPIISGTNVICAGQSTTLTASGGTSYVWNTSAATASITVSPLANTNYQVTATTAAGCTASAVYGVTVNALPTPSITGTNILCAGQSTTLTASGGASYTWSTGENTPAIIVSPVSTSTYTATATTAFGCTATASRTVTVNTLPTLLISGTNPACVSTTLTVSGASNYIWSTGSITNTQAFPVPGLTSFVVSGTDSNGCSNTISGIANVRSAATNAALASGTVNGIPLLEGCTENGWTYYVAPSNPNEYLFAVEWGTNNAARSAAIVSIEVNNALYGSTASAAVSGQGIPTGTWVMPRSWNVNIGSNTLSSPVKVRFFYDQTEVTNAIQAAVNFTTLHGLANQFIEPFIWFKTVGVAYQPNNFNSTTLNANGVYVGQSIVLQSTQGVEHGVTYAEFSNIQSFSGGTGATGVGKGNPLPITLEYFRGEKQGEKSLLTWRTQTEFNNSYFLLERSTNGMDFSVIGRVNGAGNSTTPQNYSFIDESPRPGNNYYRLRQVDFDGIEKVSDIVVLHFEKTFAVSAYPNPFEQSFTIDVVTTEESEGLIEAFDMTGRLIASEKTTFSEGNNSKVVHTQEWAPGAYIVKVSTDGFTTYETLIKSKF